MYATDASGRWESSSTSVTTPGDWGLMTVDPDGVPDIVVNWGGLEYRTIVGSEWVTERLPGDAGGAVEAMVTGGDGSVHLLDWNSEANLHVYAVRDQGNWSILFLDVEVVFSPFMLADHGIEIVDTRFIEDPEHPGCLECHGTTQLRYTGPGPLDENCDGVAE